MNALEAEIRALIRLEGPLTIERFMAMCLTHPRHGYYMTQEPFGAAGDFVTAPEISQMFGELIGLWAAQAWINMGQPETFNFIELGPGRGTLMADALRAAGQVPGFSDAVSLHLVEASPKLRAAQHVKLSPFQKIITWHEVFGQAPEAPCVILANEFFDALPIRQFAWRQDGSRTGGWHECLVGIGGSGGLTFGLAGAAAREISRTGRGGDVLEICPSGIALAGQIGARLAQAPGAALIIDYGYADAAAAPTLQAVKAHAYAPVLAEPGEADLTAHVDFRALAAAARAGGAAVYPAITQAALMERLGIDARAAKLKAGTEDAAVRAGIDAARQRLAGTGDDAMGRLFKALAMASPGQPPPPAFEAADPLMES